MARFIVRVYSPFDNSVIDHRIEAKSRKDARKKSYGVTLASLVAPYPEFEIEDVFIITVIPIPDTMVRPAIRVSLRYDEIKFKDWRGAVEYADVVKERAIEGPSEYIFGYKGRMTRGDVYKSYDPMITKPRETGYWIVKKPARRPKNIRVWKVAIPGFALCAVMDGRRAKHMIRAQEGFKWKGELLEGKILQLCDYHSGALITRVPIQDRVFKVPEGVCAFYCPQCLYYKSYSVEEGRDVWHGYCRAYMPVMSEFERKKRVRRYRGMTMLCLDDDWWSWWWKR